MQAGAIHLEGRPPPDPGLLGRDVPPFHPPSLRESFARLAAGAANQASAKRAPIRMAEMFIDKGRTVTPDGGGYGDPLNPDPN